MRQQIATRRIARPSIQRRLLLSVIAVLVIGIATTGGIVYRQARDEANELFDLQLRQIAQTIPVRLFGSMTPEALDQVGSGENVVVRIWNRVGGLVYGSHSNVILPRPVQLGLTTVTTTQTEWRVFAALVDDDILLEVAQPVSVRRTLAAQVALRTVLPLLILLPVMGIVLWWVVGRGLAPLRRIASDVATRRPEALERLSEDRLPEEVAPLVESLNRLLADLSTARDAQRAFIADAAHELRTPLTAVQLQLQIVERADDREARAVAIDALRGGLARASRLVEQLLALARAEPETAAPQIDGNELVAKSTSSVVPSTVDLVALASDAVTMHAELAHDRGIDLGFNNAGGSFVVDGDRDALFTLLGNLIDNALRYTPRGGRVDVGVERRGDETVLSVADDGPGIAEHERPRVFDRFHRGDAARLAGDTRGSGLGLAIVKRIADRHRAEVELGTPVGGRGLQVDVLFNAKTARVA
jgi:two-component system OmpR family sensor kinase